jgi:hypothetical protein
MDHQNLEYIVSHVFLPPRLPQEDDYDADKSAKLIEEVHKSLVEFLPYVPELEHSKWNVCVKMIDNMRVIHGASGGLSAECLENMLGSMSHDGTRDEMQVII